MIRPPELVPWFFLLQAMSAFGVIDRFIYGEWGGKPGDKLTKGLALLFTAASLWLFVHGFRRLGNIRSGAILSITAACLLIASVGWSIDPGGSMRRGILYLSVVVGVIGLTGSLDSGKFMRLLAATCFLCAATSVVLLIANYNDAVMGDDTGAVRGIFPHKNYFGQVMAVGALATLHRLRSGDGGRAWNISTLLIFLILTVMSRSSTALVVALVFCLGSGIGSLLCKGGTARVCGLFLLVLSVPIGLVILLDPSVVLDFLGKDSTLTGRTDLWTYIYYSIEERPLLGWGFFAFWSANNPEAIQISHTLGWTVPEAHNGLLQMLLDGGVVTAALFIFLLVRNVSLAVRCLHTSEMQIAVSTLLCNVGIVVAGISESVLMDPLELTTIVFFATGLFSERAARQIHSRRHLRVPSVVTPAASRGRQSWV